MADLSIITLIGPEHHGSRMTLEEFARAEGQPGYLYELERGTVVVVDVPGVPHARIVRILHKALERYDDDHPGRIEHIGVGGQAAMQMPGLQSERHPDLAIYFTPAPSEDAQAWQYWIPDIAIEVVSASSATRDYSFKREEYLKAGVRLYWIVDPRDHAVTALQRCGDTWQEQQIPGSGKLTTPLLPGFEMPLARIFRNHPHT